MTSKFHIIDLQQDGEIWIQWRWTGLGGSDAPTIMGQNPWKSAKKLLNERLHQISPPVNEAMMAGKRDEPIARAAYIEKTQNHVEPACLQCREHPFMLASVDGIDFASETILEIKCGKGSYYKSLRMDGHPPDYYMAQLQHILAVTGFDQIDYYSWRPDARPLLQTIERDDLLIEEIIDHEHIFWTRLQELSGR